MQTNPLRSDCLPSHQLVYLIRHVGGGGTHEMGLFLESARLGGLFVKNPSKIASTFHGRLLQL